MATGSKLLTENDAAVNSLYQLLSDNLYNTYWKNYASGHQERMNNINTVLKSDGGKATIEALIQMIDQTREAATLIANAEKAKDKEFRKKHPFKNFFSSEMNEHYKICVTKRNFVMTLDTIKSELVAALRLVNVIELSGLSNKPKVG